MSDNEQREKERVEGMREAHRMATAAFAPPSRFRASLPFRERGRTHKCNSAKLFGQVAFFLSGGDLEGLLTHFLSLPKHAALKERVSAHIRGDPGRDTKKLEALVHSVKEQHQAAATASERRALLRLVQPHLPRGVLGKRFLWEVGKGEWDKTHKKIKQTPKPLPPNCHPLPESTRKLVLEFYFTHTVPAGNETRYNKITKTHEPARALALTKRELYQNFVIAHGPQLSYSKFCVLAPVWVIQAKQKLYVCGICEMEGSRERASAQGGEESPTQAHRNLEGARRLAD